MVSCSQSYYASQILFFLALSLSKCSILALILRVVEDRKSIMRRLCIATTALSAIWGLLSVLLVTLDCSADRMLIDSIQCPAQVCAHHHRTLRRFALTPITVTGSTKSHNHRNRRRYRGRNLHLPRRSRMAGSYEGQPQIPGHRGFPIPHPARALGTRAHAPPRDHTGCSRAPVCSHRCRGDEPDHPVLVYYICEHSQSQILSQVLLHWAWIPSQLGRHNHSKRKLRPFGQRQLIRATIDERKKYTWWTTRQCIGDGNTNHCQRRSR